MLDRSLPKHTVRDAFFILIVFAFLIRLSVGMAYFNQYDTYWYRDWAFALQNGLFDIYSKADQISLDYPPIYLFFLFLTGQAYKVLGNDSPAYMQMLLMKFWPIVFDLLCGVVLYLLCSKYGRLTGLFAAGIWLFNPSLLFNTAFWGQTDQLMCLLLLVSFWLMEKNRPVLCCVAFAVAGMTKFQCLYFTPVLLVGLYYKSGIISFFKGIGAAAVTVATVFLPFMIGAKNPFLFLDVYLKGQGAYPHCTLNAFNYYGMFGLNFEEDSLKILGGLTVNMVSIIITILSVVSVLLLYIFGKKKSGWVGGLFLMQCLFMLTSRMHERYQIATLIFALMAFVVHKNRRFLALFIALSVITFFNQLVPMFHWNQSSFLKGADYGVTLALFSVINFGIFLWSVFECYRFFMIDTEEKQNTNETGVRKENGIYTA